MKRMLNIVMFFFILAFTLVFSVISEPSVIRTQQPCNSTDYIIGSQSETVVLISNNIFKGKLSSRQKEDNSDCPVTTPLLISFNLDNNIFSKNTLNFNKIKNNYLSNNEQTIYQIRAP